MIHLRSSLSLTSLVPSPAVAAVSLAAVAVVPSGLGLGVHLPRLARLDALGRRIVLARRPLHVFTLARVHTASATGGFTRSGARTERVNARARGHDPPPTPIYT